MRHRNDQLLRLAIVWFLMGARMLIVFAGCMPSTATLPAERGNVALWSSLLPGSFGKLWTERTILLGQLSDGFRLPALSPLGGSPPDGDGPFPLIVRATLVDSVLIEAGIREYGRLASMTDEELSAFQSAYHAKHDVDNSLFVWLELQTSYTDDFLKLERWIIFLEDETKQQFEPMRVVEHPMQKRPPPDAAADRAGRNSLVYPGELTWPLTTKAVELYFPKKRYDGAPLLSATTKTLKLVVLEPKNTSVRAEGSWDFSSFTSP